MEQWLKEHIKTLPPLNVTEEQRQAAIKKIEQMKALKIKNSI